MWVYTAIKKVENVKGNSFFLALFFFSHYTGFYCEMQSDPDLPDTNLPWGKGTVFGPRFTEILGEEGRVGRAGT